MEIVTIICDWPDCEREANYYTYGLGDACAHHFCPYMERPPLSVLEIMIKNLYEQQGLWGLSNPVFMKLYTQPVKAGETFSFPINPIVME